MAEHIEDAVLDITPVENKEQALTKLDKFSSVEQMRSYCQYLIDGKLIPTSLRTPDAVMSVVLMGKELGFDPLASLSNIVVIQGRPTLGIHAIGALLRKSGAASRTMEDFVPIMGEVGTDKEGKVVDYRTTIRFYRPYRDMVLEEDTSFTWKEATKMGLTDKDNWKRMPKVMLYSRCFSLGARRVAPDAMLGLYETAEAAEFSGQKHMVTEDGEVTVIS